MQSNHLLSLSNNEFSVQSSPKKTTFRISYKSKQQVRDSNKCITDKLNCSELSYCENQQMQIRLLQITSAQNGNRRTKESDELANLLMRRQNYQKKTQQSNIQTVDYDANISNSQIKAASQTIDFRHTNVVQSILSSLPVKSRDRRSKTTINKASDQLNIISNSFSSRFQTSHNQEFFRAKSQIKNQVSQQEQPDSTSSIVIPVKQKVQQRQWNASYQIGKDLLNIPFSPERIINVCTTSQQAKQQQYSSSLSCKNSPNQLDSKISQNKKYSIQLSRQRRLLSETKPKTLQQEEDSKSANSDNEIATQDEDKMKEAPEVPSRDPQNILRKCEMTVQKSIKLLKQEIKEEKGVNDVVKAFEKKQMELRRQDSMLQCCTSQEIQMLTITQQFPSRSFTPNTRLTQNISFYQQNMHSRSQTAAQSSPSKLAASPFRGVSVKQETSPKIKLQNIIFNKQSQNNCENSLLLQSKDSQINSLVQTLSKQHPPISKQLPLNQLKRDSVVLPKQSILKEKIKESLKRVEKCLDFSVVQSEQQTIQLDQTPLIAETPQKFELFITSEYKQKTATMLINEKNHEFIVVPILLADYATLPFDLSKIERSPEKFKIGEGSSGKVFKIKLGWNYDRSSSSKEGQNKTNQQNEEQDKYLQALNQQLLEQAQQYVAVKVLKYYDEQCLAIKANELIIEKYLADQQYRHLCNIQPPTYFMDKKGYSELFIVQDIADFNFQKVIDKRRMKFFSYSERELLSLAKAFLVQKNNKIIELKEVLNQGD